jgi:hypothetical protein
MLKKRDYDSTVTICGAHVSLANEIEHKVSSQPGG